MVKKDMKLLNLIEHIALDRAEWQKKIYVADLNWLEYKTWFVLVWCVQMQSGFPIHTQISIRHNTEGIFVNLLFIDAFLKWCSWSTKFIKWGEGEYFFQ